MQDKYIDLRQKHPVFTYEKYEITDHDDRLSITYYFNIEDYVTFTPTWEFKKKHEGVAYGNDFVVDRLAFNLGLVELISYWKCACPPLVQIKAGYIDEEQIKWWKSQYYLGLGEFFYTNKIETGIDEFMRIEVMAEDSKTHTERVEFEKSGCLIPVGGGKDSNVTLELLSDRKEDNLCYMINNKLTSRLCAQAAGYSEDEILVAKRSLDKRLLELNQSGYLNGHTPFSAIVAFSSVLTAYLYDKKYVVLSNEASANESTVAGTEVNHQYSKSFKFEQDFIDYELKYINSGVHYFSLLRPFSEFQIAKFFAKQDKYHMIFRSCNVGSKKDEWCCDCSKCLFVYIILSPFIELERLAEMFGEDMLNKESLIPIFDKLIGAVPEKPFECVGTCDEINTAISIVIEKMQREEKQLPKLYDYYKKSKIYTSYRDQSNNPYMNFYSNENAIPSEFVDRIKTLMLK